MVDVLRTINVNRSGIIWSRDNTTIELEHCGMYLTPGYEMLVHVRLHGSKICTYNRTGETVTFRDCGYQTATTKSRLNALLAYFSNVCIIRAPAVSLTHSCRLSPWSGPVS